MSKTECKKSQESALRLFTRCRNNLIKSIKLEECFDLVQRKFDDLTQKYTNVQLKHEEYILSIEEETDFNQYECDMWMDAVDETFSETERIAHDYLTRKGSVKKEKDQQISEVNCQGEESKKYSNLREFEKTELFNEIRKVNKLLENNEFDADIFQGLLKDSQKDLKTQMERCKNAQAQFLSVIDSEQVKSELLWTNDIHDAYTDITAKLLSKTRKSKEDVSNLQRKTYGLKLQPMPLPKFDGDIREYPRFRKDFQGQVVPSISESQQSYVLKSCLSGVPLDIVKNVDDNIDEMWFRLDDKYGEPTRVIDSIMREIKKLKPGRDGETMKFILFVDTVERAFRDLESLGLEREVSNASTVSMIEDKLSPEIKLKWAEFLKQSKNQQLNKFPLLLKFLLERKSILEYVNADIRSSNETRSGSVAYANANTSDRKPKTSCWLCNVTSHTVDKCEEFLSKDIMERCQLVKDNNACCSYLKVNHSSIFFYNRRKCTENGCEMSHHILLHEPHEAGQAHHAKNESGGCLLQLMNVDINNGEKATLLWDGGATISLITFRKALELGLKGKEVDLSVTKIGGTKQMIKSYKYEVGIKAKDGKFVDFILYGIDKISTPLRNVNLDEVIKLFPDAKNNELQRPVGEIDILIGFEYAGFHPTRKQSNGHLLLLENMFGNCLGGSHPLLSEKTRKIIQHAVVNHVKIAAIEDFFDIERLGVECTPKCGNCRCGECPIGGKEYTIKEERELKLIEEGLRRMHNHWVATYPWIRDPKSIQNNRNVAFAMLKSTEKRLLRDKTHAQRYTEQIHDMLNRKVAIKLTDEVLKSYSGPVHYISHHEVLKEDSSSTPCRIVFNSSAKFNGVSLNDFWAKGPDVMNNMLGILLRFREGCVALAGDIKKMYHSVHLSELDQHTHRFLWRELDEQRAPETYAMTRVCFGDKPAGAIATVALRLTALENKEKSPRAVDMIVHNTYVDDMLDSFNETSSTIETVISAEEILKTGGFEVKKWTSNIALDEVSSVSSQSTALLIENDISKVLGMSWNPQLDRFIFKVSLNFAPKRRKVKLGPDLTRSQLQDLPLKAITKRSVLSQICGIYDPLGLLTPFTVRAKIMMQNLWKNDMKGLSWDDTLPESVAIEWIHFFQEMFDVEKLSFKRCFRPKEAVGKPMLIIFSDASKSAYGTCAYIRWERVEDKACASLMAAKGKVAPIKIITLPRLELCGAILAKRLYVFIKKECRFEFSKIVFVVDSEIVQSMTQKDSYGFKTFASTRIGEIQESTSKDWWAWTTSENNISDWMTRPKKPEDLDENSTWQLGPAWLQLPEKEWPITFKASNVTVPDEIKLTFAGLIARNEASAIDINRFSKFKRLINVTARVLSVFNSYKGLSLYNIGLDLTLEGLREAELYWINEAQSIFQEIDLKKRFARLGAKRRSDGIIIVNGRLENWMKSSYNTEEIVLLPADHRLSRLYVELIHNETHLGIAAICCKVRLKFWIVNLEKLVRSVRFSCVLCKKQNKQRIEQIMAPLPNARLNPAPVWSQISLDLFGPFVTKGEVNKRSRGKAYGVIITCLLTRAVHIDGVPDYSTDTFLQALRRFMSLRGSPQEIYSDPGSQLQGANNVYNSMIASLEKGKLEEFGLDRGFKWNFSPADAPWHNGCSESLIRACKKSIHNAIGDQVLTMIELLTVFYECANLVNERPIGKTNLDISDGAYLCPNDMLLGRATSKIPSGPYDMEKNLTKRLEFIQGVIQAFWIKWNRFYFPSLIVRPKWHVESRNLHKDDIVLIQDSNAVRGNWKMGRVTEAIPGADGKVRDVKVQYKNTESVITIDRPVQRLVLLLPYDEQSAGNVS